VPFQVPSAQASSRKAPDDLKGGLETLCALWNGQAAGQVYAGSWHVLFRQQPRIGAAPSRQAVEDIQDGILLGGPAVRPAAHVEKELFVLRNNFIRF
jgi:hypothetical protein